MGKIRLEWWGDRTRVRERERDSERDRQRQTEENNFYYKIISEAACFKQGAIQTQQFW